MLQELKKKKMLENIMNMSKEAGSSEEVESEEEYCEPEEMDKEEVACKHCGK